MNISFSFHVWSVNKISLIRHTLLITVLFFSQNSFAQSNEFIINNNGSIQIDNLSFNNINAYINSDYFRSSGRKCNSADKNSRFAANAFDAKAAKSISDCCFAKLGGSMTTTS